MPADLHCCDSLPAIHAHPVALDCNCEYATDCDKSEQQRPRASTAATLGALRPTALLPTQDFHGRSRNVSALRSVEFVEVSKTVERDGKTFYCVDVFHRDASSHIPVHGHFARGGTLQPAMTKKKMHVKPTVRIEYAFSDFLQLRYDSYELARSGHLFQACAFCSNVMDLDENSSVKPRWNTQWFKSDESVCDMLSTYLAELLRFAQHVPVSGAQQCIGLENIPTLLHEFLQSQ